MRKITALALALALGSGALVPASSMHASIVAHGHGTLTASNDADASWRTGCWAQNASGAAQHLAASAGRKIDMESSGILT